MWKTLKDRKQFTYNKVQRIFFTKLTKFVIKNMQNRIAINRSITTTIQSSTFSFTCIKNKSTVATLFSQDRLKELSETLSNSSSSEKCSTKLSQTFGFMDNQSQYFCHIYYPVNKMLMDIISWSFLRFQNSNNLSHSSRLLFCCKSINFTSYIRGKESAMYHFTEITH